MKTAANVTNAASAILILLICVPPSDCRDQNGFGAFGARPAALKMSIEREGKAPKTQYKGTGGAIRIS